MSSIRIASLVVVGFALAIEAQNSAQAALTLTTGLGTTHVGNLVTNGSFEIGAPPSGGANLLYWATGTAQLPFAVPTGWSSFGSSVTYASWGNSGTFPQSLVGSAPIPDGNAAMYFGNGGPAFVDQPPTFNADGSVSFPLAPNFSSFFGPPATLSQTINTPATPAALYKMSFWVSGEDATGASPFQERGIFGFQITNVLPGDPVQWLAVPNGVNNTFGTSHLYEYTFAPLNPLLPVGITFINPGHLDLAAYGLANFTTELVLDDVIINAVPEPGSWALAVAAALGIALMRRRIVP
jgi:hypothetical protein